MIKVILSTLVTTASLFALSHFEVAQKSDKTMSGFEDSKSKMTMKLINSKGQTRIRQMKSKSLELEGGDKSLMEFLSPADVKGTKFLNYEHAKKDDDQWLYLPALKRVKRISSKNKSGAFMGSEFSYEDISSFNIEKYDYKTEQAKEIKLNGKNVYVVERYPNYKYSGYTKQVSYIDTNTFLTMQVDYYDRKKALLKSAYFSQYKLINGVYRNGQIHMKNFSNSKQSILVWEEESIKNSLTNKDFHRRVLKK
ncbi:MAG: outer membrane lipoprotein-sorting protein [Arcobacter sp.]|nr:outer membrane lipoprotein-sorting protein [Arcobacter sp.]